MDKVFMEMFSKPPDEVINGDYYYQLPYRDVWTSEVDKRAESLGFPVRTSDEQQELMEHISRTVHRPFWDDIALKRTKGTALYEPWMDTIEAVNIINEIAAERTPFLDIASSESMGFAPYIIAENPETPCLITDINSTTIRNLRSIANEHFTEHNINMASFDNLEMPLKDNSLMYITSRHGITSSVGMTPLDGPKVNNYQDSSNRETPISEVYRVLKNGGRFMTLEMNRECDFDLRKVYDCYNENGNLFGVYTLEEIQAIMELLIDEPWRNKFEAAGFEVEFEKKYYKKYSLGQVMSFLHEFSNYHEIRRWEKRTWREQRQIESFMWNYSDEAKKAEDNGFDIYGIDAFYILRKPNEA